MNNKLFWCGTKIACGRWQEPYHLLSLALCRVMDRPCGWDSAINCAEGHSLWHVVDS
jgi:hypothetical protein